MTESAVRGERDDYVRTVCRRSRLDRNEQNIRKYRRPKCLGFLRDFEKWTGAEEIRGLHNGATNRRLRPAQTPPSRADPSAKISARPSFTASPFAPPGGFPTKPSESGRPIPKYGKYGPPGTPVVYHPRGQDPLTALSQPFSQSYSQPSVRNPQPTCVMLHESDGPRHARAASVMMTPCWWHFSF